MSDEFIKGLRERFANGKGYRVVLILGIAGMVLIGASAFREKKPTSPQVDVSDTALYIAQMEDRLEQMVLEGQRVLGLPQAVDRITHPVKLAVYGAYAMPALVFGRQVVLYGRVPAFEEVLSLLEMDKNRQY